MLSSVVLSILFDSGTKALIRHFVLQGSSHWSVGRNVTRKADILDTSSNCFQLTANDGSYEFIFLLDYDMHFYIPVSAFICAQSSNAQSYNSDACVVSSMFVKSIQDCSWQTVKHIVYKVHRLVCGDFHYFDIKLWWTRNKFWKESVQRYLTNTVETCSGCRPTS